jgi:hypothetical protein
MTTTNRFRRPAYIVSLFLTAILVTGTVFAFSNASARPGPHCVANASARPGSHCAANAPARCCSQGVVNDSTRSGSQQAVNPSDSTRQIVSPEMQALRAAQDSILLRYPSLKMLQFKDSKGRPLNIFGRAIGC